MAPPPAPARVMLRPLGSPLPLSLAGLAVASFLVSGLDLGWVAAADSHQVGALLLAASVPLLAFGAALAFLARDATIGGTVGSLAGLWAAQGVVRVISAPGSTSPALGLVLLAGGALVVAYAVVVGTGRVAAAVAFGGSGVRFVLAGIYELSAVSSWQDASGVLGLVVAAVAAGAALRAEVQDARRADVEREPGVRDRL